MPVSYEPLKICMTRPRVQSCSMQHKKMIQNYSRSSPTLFNIFLERIKCGALDDHEGSVSIGGRLITNFRFVDEIVVNAEEEDEAGVLIDSLDRTTTR